MKKLLLSFSFLFFTVQSFSQEANNDILGKVILRMSDSVEGDTGRWHF